MVSRLSLREDGWHDVDDPRGRSRPCLETLLVVVAGLCALAPCVQGTEPSNPALRAMLEAKGGDFTLTSHHGGGATVSLQDYRGKVLLLTFCYTSCPDTCPLVLTRIRHTLQALGERENQVLTPFVTFDPDRDTPEQLKTCLQHFHPQFVGLTGTADAIRAVSRQYGVSYLENQGIFAHSDYVYLIDRQGRLHARYPSSAPLERMTSDIEQMVENRP